MCRLQLLGYAHLVVITLLSVNRVIAQDWEQRLSDDMVAANNQFESGELLEGGTVLIEGLRALPSEVPALADPAAGNVQFLLFAMEYLMTEPQTLTFTTQVLDTANSEMDNFIATLYNLQIGQDSAGKTIAAQNLMGMTGSTNQIIRVGALFILCEPYYFSDEVFQNQHRALLLAEYPDLDITQEAIQLAILAASGEPIETQANVLSKAVPEISGIIVSTENRTARSGGDKKNAFVQRMQHFVDNMRVPDRVDEALEGLSTAAIDAPDWHTRYGALHMLETYHNRGEQQRVYATLNNLVNRAEHTPEVARARTLLVRKAIADWEQGRTPPGGTQRVLRHVDDLLALQWEEHTLERVLWEDRIKSVVDLANLMVQQGKPNVAIELCERLIAKYPNSQVAERCQLSIEEFRQGRRSVSLE